MVGEHPVFLAGERVGTAAVHQEGMFWHIRCCCDGAVEVPCVLQARWSEEVIDLGLCGKEEGSIRLTARLNRKRTPAGMPVFCLVVKHRGAIDSFHPISPQEPFAYIAKLKYAYLVTRGGKVGVALKGQTDNINPTGQ